MKTWLVNRLQEKSTRTALITLFFGAVGAIFPEVKMWVDMAAGVVLTHSAVTAG